MRVGIDATTLIALGTVGELDLLDALDGDPVVPPAVAEEVTTEPARTNLDRFLDGSVARLPDAVDASTERAQEILDEETVNGDVELVALVLAETEAGRDAGVVSDDRRVRTVTRGFGATVTGTVGVVVRAVDERELRAEEGKDLIRRIDGHGLHMTGGLRETAYELVEDAAETE